MRTLRSQYSCKFAVENAKQRFMKAFNIHPHKGFLNTQFAVKINDLNIPLIKAICTGSGDECEINASNDFIFPSAGIWTLSANNEEQTIVVEDAVKFGGSNHKASYVFENTPWCFIVMRDRTYFHNRETKEEYVESISPDKIEYVNEYFVLFKNAQNNDFSLYSLENQSPVLYFNKYAYICDHALVLVDEEKQALQFYSLNDKCISKFDFPFDYYSNYEEHGLFYIAKDTTIRVVNLSVFFTTEIKNSFPIIGFTNKYYAILQDRDNAIIQDLSQNRCVGTIDIRKATNIEGYQLSDVNLYNIEIQQCIDKVFEQAKSLERHATIEFQTEIISKIHIIGNDIYYVVQSQKRYVDKYGSIRLSNYCNLKRLQGNLNIEIPYHMHDLTLWNNDYLCVYAYPKIMIIQGDDILYQAQGTWEKANGIIVFKREESDKETTTLYTLTDDFREKFICQGKLNMQYYKQLNIVENQTKKNLLQITRTANNLIGATNIGYYVQSGFCNPTQTIKMGQDYIYYNGVATWKSCKTLPEYINAISEKGNYAISHEGAHCYIHTLNRSYYEKKEILEDIFDSTKYGKVFMSDDGNNVLYQSGNDMALMNIADGTVEEFPNLVTVEHINGYRPLFMLDAYRKPRIINPLTRSFVDEKYLNTYKFVSIDGNYYALTSLIIKYQLKTTKNFFTEEEYNECRKEYDYPLNPSLQVKYRIKHNRNRFISETQLFKDKSQKDLALILEEQCFTKYMFEKISFAVIKDKKQETIAEIQLGERYVKYFNYISFSLDSNYVTIAGAYDQILGILVVYDLKEHKTIYSNATDRAVWTSVFTKNNKFAAYSSEPNAYISSVDMIKPTIIEGRSFLAFSPDGKFIAFSDQNYIPHHKANPNWGHQPSTNVYINKVDNPHEQVLPTISDLSDAGVEGSNLSQTVVSCSFSLNNSKLMMVGRDGVIVIRNIHLEEK